MVHYGSIECENSCLHINKETNPEDYNIISKWIKPLK